MSSGQPLKLSGVMRVIDISGNPTEDKLSELLKVLLNIESDPSIEAVVPNELKDGYQEHQLHPLVQEAIHLANEVLITASGGINRAAVLKVKNSGFSVFPGETDSFGWLTGCILTTKGIVVFG